MRNGRVSDAPYSFNGTNISEYFTYIPWWVLLVWDLVFACRIYSDRFAVFIVNQAKFNTQLLTVSSYSSRVGGTPPSAVEDPSIELCD